MSYQYIKFSRRDGFAQVTLNRPDSLNAFTAAMHEELAEALTEIEADASVRALLLTGTGRGFCAGQDLSDRKVSADGEAPDLGYSIETYYNPLLRRLRALPMPVVCAVNGVAAGAGANIALSCDLVLAARSARFIQAFCRLGLVPDSGGTWLLPRLVGDARARAMALLGEPVPAEEAQRIGLIYRAVDDEQLMAEARGLCARLASAPTRGLAAIKRLLQSAWTNDYDSQLDLERDTQRELGRSDDYREGVAAFLEKREAKFSGR